MFLLYWEVYTLMELVVNLQNEVGRGLLLIVVCTCVLVGV